MFYRFIAKPSYYLRPLTLVSSQTRLSNHKHHPPLSIQPPLPNPSFFNCFPANSRHFSSNHDDINNINGKLDMWKISSENQNIDSVFGDDTGSLEGIVAGEDDNVLANLDEESWLRESKEKEVDKEDDIFKGIDDSKAIGTSGIIDDEWETTEGYKDWNFVVEEGKEEDVFDVEIRAASEMTGYAGDERMESQKNEEEKQLELEEKTLSAVLQGSHRAFGDIVAASGITEEMLDSLMALKDLDGVEGLPPLSEIEDLRYEKNTRKSTRAEIERQKQEEIAKSRVRQVDNKGRAYGTGKRKCSIARVWIQPGDGKFTVNDKQFDVYFPMLDHRAALLRPFSETKTLGRMDVCSTVKGGGVSGQVGAIRLGISRALQSWAPQELRPPLKEAGFLTRDSRVVERKKPGKAKARKSFQWVKR